MWISNGPVALSPDMWISNEPFSLSPNMWSVVLPLTAGGFLLLPRVHLVSGRDHTGEQDEIHPELQVDRHSAGERPKVGSYRTGLWFCDSPENRAPHALVLLTARTGRTCLTPLLWTPFPTVRNRTPSLSWSPWATTWPSGTPSSPPAWRARRSRSSRPRITVYIS